MLRSEREKRNLNINDIANQLKIKPRQLRAIEEGELDSLPHPAYARGFIRSYAGALGFGQEEIQQILDSLGSASPRPAPKKIDENPAEDAVEEKKSHKGLYFLIVLCALAAGVWYLWDSGKLASMLQSFSRPAAEVKELQSADAYLAAKDAEKARRSEVENRLEPAAEKDASMPALPPEEAVEKPALTGQAMTASEKPAHAENPAEAGKPEAAAPQAAAEKPAQTQGQAPASGQHKLIITAIEECWVHSNADKTDTRQFSLRKGDTFALTFADSLELKLGNAGGVRLRYDGNDLPPPGTSGQVRTLVFPPKSNS